MAMAVAVMISTTTSLLSSSITSSHLYLSPSTTTTTTTTTTHLRFLSTSSHKTQIIKEEELFLKRRRRRRKPPLIPPNISSQNPPPPLDLEEVEKEEEQTSCSSASDIVKNFYNGINKRDLASVEDLIADKCVYEDLIFPQPFIGRQAILEFFNKFTGSISKDLQFVIDDISDEDSLAIGVTWHLDWQGRPFPFSKGCSFYRLELINGKKQIIYARDSVEPAIKPGEAALVAIRGVTRLLQRFPGIADKF